MNKIYLILIITAFYYNVFGQKERKLIRDGNKLYFNMKYPEAESLYKQAYNFDTTSLEANFNFGDALYKQGKFENAETEFIKLTQRNNISKENLSTIYYNAGNSQLKQSEEFIKNKKLEEAIKTVEKSIESYKNSLRNNPSDIDSKYNLALANNLLKELKKQEQQQNQNQQENQNKDEESDKKDKENKDKDQSKSNDDDGDGIPNDKEKKSQNTDTDKDKTPDYKDTDSDNDGIPDNYEAGKDPKNPKDTDKDGQADFKDIDSDNDGIPDNKDPDALPQNVQMSDKDAQRLLKYIEKMDNETNNKVKLEKANNHKIPVDKDW